MPRFYCPLNLATGLELELPAGAARHVQVLRLQPGDVVTLFHGGLALADSSAELPMRPLPLVPLVPAALASPTLGGEFEARITHMGRSNVRVVVGAHHAIEREAPRAVHLLAGITANERMDWLVEKATELGVASITPLLAERSVLRLKGERADKKRAHWQAIAVAACEQCGRNRVPAVHGAVDLSDWLKLHVDAGQVQRMVLSLSEGSTPLASIVGHAEPAIFLSGPEGGLSPGEEVRALAHGFQSVGLGARVLRAETAALAALVLGSVH